MRRLWSAAAAAVLVLSAGAQQKPVIPALGETIEVSLVNVDVVVTDRDGNRVHGLGRDDFEVLENGKPQELSHFAEYREEAGSVAVTAGAESVDAPPEQRRTVVIFLERFRLQNFRVNPFIESVKKFVRETVRPGDAASIVYFQGKAKVRIGPTDSIEALERELDALAPELIGPMIDDTASTVFQVQQMMKFEEEGAAMAGSRGLKRAPTSSQSIAVQAARSPALTARLEMNRRLAAINTILQGLAGVEGKKLMLLAPRRLGEYVGAEYFYAAGVANNLMPAGERDALDNKDEVRNLIANANAAGVTVYPVYPPGLDELPADPSLPNISSPVLMNEMAMLTEIAEKTGGLTTYGTADIVKLLPRVADDMSDYYSLAYRATSKREDLARNISVRTKNPKLVVRARKQFVEKSDDSRMRDRVMAALFGEWNQSPVKLAAKLGTPKQTSRKRHAAPLEVKIPISALTLLPQGSKHQGAFSVYLMTAAKLGETSEVTRQTQTFEIPANDLQRAMGSHFTYAFDLEVKEGTTSVAVGVLDEISKTYGITRMDIP
ncbi:MAG: VWA domain-containing protein [Thermoanaerobaculia bacterium]